MNVPKLGSMVSVVTNTSGVALLYEHDVRGEMGGKLAAVLRKGDVCLVLGYGFDRPQLAISRNRMLLVVTEHEGEAKVGWVYEDNVRDVEVTS